MDMNNRPEEYPQHQHLLRLGECCDDELVDVTNLGVQAARVLPRRAVHLWAQGANRGRRRDQSTAALSSTRWGRPGTKSPDVVLFTVKAHVGQPVERAHRTAREDRTAERLRVEREQEPTCSHPDNCHCGHGLHQPAQQLRHVRHRRSPSARSCPRWRSSSTRAASSTRSSGWHRSARCTSSSTPTSSRIALDPNDARDVDQTARNLVDTRNGTRGRRPASLS